MKTRYFAALLAAASATAPASAGYITAQGAVTALTNIASIGTVNRTVDFENFSANGYAGATFLGSGTFASFGLSVPGLSSPIGATSSTDYYKSGGPIAGGGSTSGRIGYSSMLLQITESVTKFGLTAGINRTQYLTAYSKAGAVIGQVTWSPANDMAFIGIDTGSIEIGFISYGNDNVYAGDYYSAGGYTPYYDNLVWYAETADVPEPAMLGLFGLGALGLALSRRRRQA